MNIEEKYFRTLFFFLQINHRKLLDAIFTVCGVPNELFRSVSSSVDKLDKVN